MIHENQGDRKINHVPGRTHNRIRSPRLEASGQWNNVGKGSRQNSAVRSLQGVALRVGLGGLKMKIELRSEV